MQGIVRELSCDERSGVSVTSLTAHFSSDEEIFYSPDGLDMQDYYINQDYSRKNEFKMN